MSSIKTYNINKNHQLIDLNGDNKNFKLSFKVTSKSDNYQTDVFELLVVNQTQLDNEDIDTMEYKRVQSSISGNIVSDKNVYQNYFLSIKSDNEMPVEIEINLEKLPDKIPQENMEDEEINNVVNPDKKNIFKNKIFWISIIAISGIAIYFIFFGKSKKEKTNFENKSPPKLIEAKEPSPSPASSIKSSNSYSSTDSSNASTPVSKIGSPLLRKLNDM